jgi:hypothetical protein
MKYEASAGEQLRVSEKKMFTAQGSPVRSINSTPAVAIIIHKLKKFSVELLGKKTGLGQFAKLNSGKVTLT